MNFLVFLQSISHSTQDLSNLVVFCYTSILGMAILFWSLRAYNSFMVGDGDRAKKAIINTIVTLIVFSVILVSKEKILQIIENPDTIKEDFYKSISDISTAQILFLSILLGFAIFVKLFSIHRIKMAKKWEMESFQESQKESSKLAEINYTENKDNQNQ